MFSRALIKNHVMPYRADREMRAITRMDVQSWIRSLSRPMSWRSSKR